MRAKFSSIVAAMSLSMVGCGTPRAVDDLGIAGANDLAQTTTDLAHTDAHAVDAGGVNATTCDVTICLTGAASRSDGSNAEFNKLCDYTTVPGVIQSCSGGTCYNTFDSFLVDVPTGIYPSLFHALDTNGDGKIDLSDRGCAVNIVGFSWGGIAAVQLAQSFTSDSKVTASLATVKRLIVFDPYQPGASLTVPGQVQSFWEYRHSIESPTDCSATAPLGPYLGIAPHCYGTSSCLDYDYSLSPNQSFDTDDGATFLGSNIGHCDVPWVARSAAVATFKGQGFTMLPQSVTVPTP